MLKRFLFLMVMFGMATSVQARSLYWPSVVVDAELDSSGLLHVTETQTYMFDGDWNGGERQFNLRAGQFLHLQGLDRIDGAQVIPLVRGDISKVDHYELKDTTLRWRSRLPDDPKFEHKELTYRLHYTLSGVLRGRNNHFRLAHDFSFPDRETLINHFTLHFIIDPVWSGLQTPMTINQENLKPGQGVVVRDELEYHGAASPASVTQELSPLVGYTFLLILLAGLVALFLQFLRQERKVGRIGTLLPLESIDKEWLKKNVFSLPPEVVGAVWDGKIGGAEVAAILATLEYEKKIATGVQRRFLRKPVMTMELLIDRNTLTGYHRAVINKLFYNNRTNVDTGSIQERYKKVGLDLPAIIEKPIERQLVQFPMWKEKSRPVNWKTSLLGLTAAFVLLVAAGVWGRGGNDSALASTVGFLGFISLAGAVVAARLNARTIHDLPLRFALVLMFMLPLVGTTSFYLLKAVTFLFQTPVLGAAVIWNLAVFNLVLNALRIDEPLEKIAARKKMLAARNYFIQQLRSATPDLSDAWFPYLIAFGLGPKVDSWFRSYGTSVASRDSDGIISSSGTSLSSSSSSAASWTGGGGSFGGGGASGVWAAAAVAVGAGVATPSSSSGGSSSGSSGGSSSGSSSGGGGGGGW